jgi:hypothetical protein
LIPGDERCPSWNRDWIAPGVQWRPPDRAKSDLHISRGPKTISTTHQGRHVEFIHALNAISGRSRFARERILPRTDSRAYEALQQVVNQAGVPDLAVVDHNRGEGADAKGANRSGDYIHRGCTDLGDQDAGINRRQGKGELVDC